MVYNGASTVVFLLDGKSPLKGALPTLPGTAGRMHIDGIIPRRRGKLQGLAKGWPRD